MATQARRPSSHVQQRQTLLLFGLCAAIVLLSVGVLLRFQLQAPVYRPPAPVGNTIVATPVISTQVGTLVLESYTLIANPYREDIGCASVETYITTVSAQEHRCYQTLALPSLEVVANTPFGLTAEQTAAVLARADSTVFMPSPARRSGADSAFFHVGEGIYFAFWVAGDCTPRIVDGNGGYWQMPVSPSFGGPENVPYGTGYLFTLPANWQTEWRTEFSQAAPWRVCAGSTFGGS